MSAITKLAWRRNRRIARKSLEAAIRLTQSIERDCADVEQKTRQTVGHHQQGNKMADELTAAIQRMGECRRQLASALSQANSIPTEPPQNAKQE
jgi:hypothetical protein